MAGGAEGRHAVEDDQIVVARTGEGAIRLGRRQAIDVHRAAEAEERAVEVEIGAADAQHPPARQRRDDGDGAIVERKIVTARQARLDARVGREQVGEREAAALAGGERQSELVDESAAARDLEPDRARRRAKLCTTSAVSTAPGSAGSRRAASERMPTLSPAPPDRRVADVERAAVGHGRRAAVVVGEAAVADQHDRRARAAAQDRRREGQRPRQIAGLVAGGHAGDGPLEAARVGLEAALRRRVGAEGRHQRAVGRAEAGEISIARRRAAPRRVPGSSPPTSRPSGRSG